MTSPQPSPAPAEQRPFTLSQLGQATPFQEPAPQRRRIRDDPHLVILITVASIVVLVVGALLLSAGGLLPFGTGGHTVTYEVTGSGTADITYTTGGATEQVNDRGLPWSQRTDGGDTSLVRASVLAQRGERDSGSITCRISVDGNVVQTATSSGSFAVVHCHGWFKV